MEVKGNYAENKSCILLLRPITEVYEGEMNYKSTYKQTCLVYNNFQ